MITIKSILGIIAAILALASYSFYIKSILRGKTRPHIFTWGLWALIIFILFSLQISKGAGWGSVSTLVVAILCLVVSVLSLFKENNKNIKKIDIIFLIITLLTIPIWLLAKAPNTSTLLLLIVYSLAGEATIRKSWLDPHSETTILWSINAIRSIFAILALSKYNFTTLAFPVLVLFTATAMTFMLIYRRRRLAKLR